jgi:hypothetical protein
MRSVYLHTALRPFLPVLLALSALTPACAQFGNDFGIEFHGAGWLQAGRIMATSDTVIGKNDYAGNYLQNAGALFNMTFAFDPKLDGALGIGAIKLHNPAGSRNLGNLEGVQLGNYSFVNMARLTWNMGGTGARSPFSITTGQFAYKYDDNIKNLGLYLIRGSVYPQILISGFETKEMVGSANMLGAHMRNCFGESFTQDVLLVSETDLKPKYDFSLLYVATWKAGRVLELGGGANFYHWLPARSAATSPSEKHFDPDQIQRQGPEGLLDRVYALDRDTTVLAPADRPTPEDSLRISREWYSHKGVKVMGRFVFDPKPLMGDPGIFGAQDLKVYGEAALIGVRNYELIYTKMSERIPVMAGFNLPAFGFLDDFSLEVEYFPSPYVPDYAKLMEFSSAIPRSPYWNRSATDPEAKPYDTKADDWKWSLYASKVLAGHVKLSGQAASDHFRIGSQQPWFPTYDETFATWKDWYFMAKLAFFF